MTQEWFNQVAWRDFVLWAFAQDEIRESFTRETGVVLPSASSTPIAQLIDSATGVAAAARAAALAFVDWVTIHHWGLEHAPAKMRERLGAKS